jgi:SAM-dependent methyltransferase
VPLAYYARSASAAFWTEHWGGQSLDGLLQVARTSPLTELILRHLPPRGPLLEAGCGLGQYVVLLRERGRAAVGVDWSGEALRDGAARGAPLAAMDLRQLGVRAGAIAGYLSLGVVEHDPQGPDAILAEAHRALAPGGVLLLSVPYWNGLRRLGGPLLARRARRARAAGAEFYQFAFTRGELRRLLERHGFAPRGFHPYDPARILRLALRALGRPRSRGARARGGGPRRPVAPPTASPVAPGTPRPRRGAVALARRALYSPPALRLLGHMLLAVAERR